MVVNVPILNTGSYANVMRHIMEFDVRRKRTCANIQFANTALNVPILALMLNALVYQAMEENTAIQVCCLSYTSATCIQNLTATFYLASLYHQ